MIAVTAPLTRGAVAAILPATKGKTMPKFTTRDLGLAIRDHIEEHAVYHINAAGEERGDAGEVSYVDVSDANNPIVFLDNGQRFQVRIFALG
jgi:hypothetical protein